MPNRNRLATAIQTNSMEPNLGINKMNERSINKGACQTVPKNGRAGALNYRLGRMLRNIRQGYRDYEPAWLLVTTVTARRFWAHACSFEPTTAGRSLP